MPFVKGDSNINRGGRPKGSKTQNSVEAIHRAIEQEAKKRGICIYEHFVVTAYEDKAVLIALMKKILPELIIEESNEFAEEIQILTPEMEKEMQSRIGEYLE